MTPKQFETELAARKDRIKTLFSESSRLEKQIEKQLSTLTLGKAPARQGPTSGRSGERTANTPPITSRNATPWPPIH